MPVDISKLTKAGGTETDTDAMNRIELFVCAICLEEKCHCEFYRRLYPEEIRRREMTKLSFTKEPTMDQAQKDRQKGP